MKPGRDLLRFGTVGTFGFVVNAATTTVAAMVVNLYAAGFLAFVVAACFTWFCNRHWTFAHRPRQPWSRQLRKFLVVNFLGFLLYYAVYAGLVTLWPLAAAHPVLAVACGSIAGLAVNFTLSRALVFPEGAGQADQRPS